MRRCLVSLQPLDGDGLVRPEVCEALFGLPTLPSVSVDLARLHTFGLAMVGHTSLSGVQRKISLGLDTRRATLRVSLEGRQYVLKPPSTAYPHLPANEHLTMHLARRCGLRVPDFGLVPLASGELAYLVRRFDRPEGGGKLRMEDICQLAGKLPADKYRGSHELVARLVRGYATEPLVEARELVRRVLFCWWTGNGDMHLKNWALLTGPDGRQRLSPAYDLLNTRLYLPEDSLALPLGGRDRHLTARHLREYAAYAGLRPRALRRVAQELRGAQEDCLELVEASFLPEELGQSYGELLESRGVIIEELATG